MIAVHVLVNDSLDSIFQEVYPSQELKVKKNQVVQDGDLSEVETHACRPRLNSPFPGR